MRLGSLIPAAIRRTYVRKFATIIVLIAIVVAGVGAVTQIETSATLTNQRDAQLETSAQQDAAALDQWLRRQQDTARLLGRHENIKDADRSRLSISLFQEKAILPDYVEHIHYIGVSNQTILVSTNKSREGKSMEEIGVSWQRDEFDFDGQTDVIGSNIYRYQGETLMAFSSRLGVSDTAIVLVVNASQRADEFRESINGTRTQVVASDGTVQFATNTSAVLAPYEGGTNATAVRDGSGDNASVYRRDETLVGYAGVNGTDWTVVKQVETTNAYALRGQIQTSLVAILGISLAGFVLLGVLVGRDAMRKLETLAEQADAIAAGDIDTEIEETERLDEIGQLKRSFGAITDYLQTVADQADALARQEFDDPVLDDEVPGRLGESLDSMETDIESFVTDLEAAQAEAEESRREAEQMASDLESKAEEIRAAVERAADGDLTQRLDADADHESMVAIAEAFNELLAELEATISGIREFAEDVDESSDQITASAREVKTTSDEVSTTVQSIAEGARDQDDTVRDVSNEMTDLSATIEEVASSSDEVAAKSRSAVETGKDGTEQAENAIEEMNAIERTADETIDHVEALNEEMARIGEVVDLIDDIADQTNMLALNASIEAARAGEAGEGFAVVADEIKQLAEETTEATQEVDDMIADVQASTDETVADIREMGNRVTTGLETVDATVDTLEDIVTRVEEANVGVQSINDATDEQATSTSEVVSMVEEVGQISERNAEDAESAAAATQQQAASISEVTTSIQDLSGQAGDLRDLLEQFDARDSVEASEDGTETTGEGTESDQEPTEVAANGDPARDGGGPTDDS
jgi:methyl-accepting chemotaxis protein